MITIVGIVYLDPNQWSIFTFRVVKYAERSKFVVTETTTIEVNMLSKILYCLQLCFGTMHLIREDPELRELFELDEKTPG